MLRRPALALIVVGCGGPPRPGPPSDEIISIELGAPGATPDALEADAVIPVEAGLGRIAGIRSVMAAWSDGAAVIDVEPDPARPIDAVAGAVRTRLAALRPALPEEVQVHSVVRRARRARRGRYLLIDASGGPGWRAWSAAVVSIPGVRDHRSCGRREPRLVITADPHQLAARAIDVDDLARALRGATAGTLDELGATAVGRADGQDPATTVRDVAVIRDTVDVACAAFTTRGDGIVGTITLGGDDPGDAWDRVVAAAHAAGLALVPLPAARMITATAAIVGGDAHAVAQRWIAQLAATPGVEWAAAEVRERTLRLTIALAPDADALGVADATWAGAAAGSDAIAAPVIAGDGVVAVDAILRGPDRAALRGETVVAAAALARDPAIAAAVCATCLEHRATYHAADRDRCAALHVDPRAVREALRAATGGIRVDIPAAGATRPPIYLELPDLENGELLRELAVRSATGAAVPLAEVVTRSEVLELRAYQRDAGLPALTLAVRAAAAATRADVVRAIRRVIPAAEIRDRGADR